MNSINLEVNNGHWSVNKKPLTKCSKEKKEIFLLHLRMKKFKSPVQQKSESSFKKRKDEVKQQFNYKFANLQDDNLQNYPNINSLIFERKN